MKKWILITISLILLGAAGAAGYYQWITSPLFALNELRDAFERRDKANFDLYVDVNALIENVINSMVAQAIEDSMGDQNNSGAAAIGAAIGAGIADKMKPQFKTMAEESINNYFAPAKTPANVQTDKGAAPAEVPSMPSETHQGLPFYIVGLKAETRTDDSTVVTFQFRHRFFAKNFDVDLKLERKDQSWRLVHVPNFAKINKQFSVWEKEYLEAANTPIQKYLDSALSDLRFQRAFWEINFNGGGKFELGFEFRNRTGRDIKLIMGTVRVHHKETNALLFEKIFETKDVKFDGLHSFAFTSEQLTLENAPYDKDVLIVGDDQFSPSITVGLIEFSDGTMVRHYTSLAEVREAQEKYRQPASAAKGQ